MLPEGGWREQFETGRVLVGARNSREQLRPLLASLIELGRVLIGMWEQPGEAGRRRETQGYARIRRDT